MLTILLVCPRSVITCVLADDTRGSKSVMCRALVPAARIWLLIPGRAEMERSGCVVVRVSTVLEVVRSMVRIVWSCEAVYATVGSSGLKITSLTGPEWEVSRESGPRCGVDVDVVSFLRFAVGPELISDESTAGADDFCVLHSPTVPSLEPDNTRCEGPCTAIESTLPL